MRATITGLDQAMRSMSHLTPKLRNQHMRIAMNAALGVIKKRMVANAPKDTGLLKKSLRVKVKIPAASYDVRHHDLPPWGLVGPGRRVVLYVSKTGKISGKTLSAAVTQIFKKGGSIAGRVERGKPVMKKATRYAHFAEKGRQGKGGSQFMQSAAQQGAAEAAAKFTSKIREGLHKVAAELAAKS